MMKPRFALLALSVAILIARADAQGIFNPASASVTVVKVTEAGDGRFRFEPGTYVWDRGFARASSGAFELTGAEFQALAGKLIAPASEWAGAQRVGFTVLPARHMVRGVAHVQVVPIVGMLANVSTRTRVADGATVIPGVAKTGGSLDMLARAVGPGLRTFGVSDALPDPSLQFYIGAAKVNENDNWSGTAANRGLVEQTSAVVGAFPLQSQSLDAATVFSLEAATATMQVKGVAGTSGSTLIELYPVAGRNSRNGFVVNSAVRNEVVPGGETIVGFVIQGAPVKLLLRAVGPGLAPYGVASFLPNPRLDVRILGQGETLLANDDWNANAAEGAIVRAAAAAVAFPLADNSRDAALVTTLAPGAYTAVASGGGGSGEVLVELYAIAPGPVGEYSKDVDGDGVADWAELQLGGDPLRADTNSDGIPDIVAVGLGFKPADRITVSPSSSLPALTLLTP